MIALILPIIIITHLITAKICQNNDYHCSDRNGLQQLQPEDRCTERNRLCDGFVDCPFGDDEHNCPSIYPDGWICPSDGTYIPLEWSCFSSDDDDVWDDIWDCPNQDDVNSIYCNLNNCVSSDSMDVDNDYFSCTDNGRCIKRHWTCDGEYDCMDGSDEDPILCGNMLLLQQVETQTTYAPSKPTRNPSASPTINPTDNPTMKPTDNPTIKPTHNPTMKPTDNPTIKPTDNPTIKPTDNHTIKPTRGTRLTTIKPSVSKSPLESPTFKPSEYYASNVFLRIFISEIVDIAQDSDTESAMIKSLSKVLAIDRSKIAITNMVNLSDIINKDNDDSALPSITKWSKKGANKSWKTYRKKGRKKYDYDDMDETNFISVDVDINIDSLQGYEDLMDNLYGPKWQLSQTENYVGAKLRRILGRGNIKVHIEQISTTALSVL